MAETGKRLIYAAATLDFGSIAANDDAELTASVDGAALGQVVSVSAPSLDSGLVATGYVSAAGTVTVRVSNVTAGAIDPASQAFYLAVTQP